MGCIIILDRSRWGYISKSFESSASLFISRLSLSLLADRPPPQICGDYPRPDAAADLHQLRRPGHRGSRRDGPGVAVRRRGDHPRPAALEGLTALELTGADRTGLLSEVFAVLADMECSVVEARAWTHRGRLACVAFLRGEDADAGRVPRILAHADRRLH